MARQQIPFCIFSLSSQTTAERVGGILVLSSPLLPRAPTSVGAKRGREAAERSEAVRNLWLAVKRLQLAD